MSRLRATARRWKVLAVATVGAALSYWLAPADIIATVSGELVNFFGFVIAAVLPAMALTATSLRGSGMSVRRLVVLRSALERQMTFWTGLVIVSFIAVAFIVALKPIVACAPNAPCKAVVAFEYGGYALDTRVANAVMAYVFALVFMQLNNVLRGLRALLAVNAEAAIGEAQQRFDDRMASTEAAVGQIRNPQGYGAVVELPGDGRG